MEYRLIVVDDEPEIVDGLYELLVEQKELNLDVYKANSGDEAMGWLKRTKIDIVLSDIRMPGMSGLQLLKNIRIYWPRCRVIFLTGYNDFTFAKDAIHYSAVEYLLKTEGDEKILEAVEKAVSDIEKELRDEQLILKATQQLQLAGPLLQQEFLSNLLWGEKILPFVRDRKFVELEINLDPKTTFLLIVGRVDSWSEDIGTSERLHQLHQIQGMAQQYLSPKVKTVSVVHEDFKLLWMVQPEDTSEAWDRLVTFAMGTLEYIQASCRELLKLSISFALAGEPCHWERAGEKLDTLKALLNRGFGLSSGILMTENMLLEQQVKNGTEGKNSWTVLKNMELLDTYLENGQKTDFWGLFLKIVYSVRVDGNKWDNNALEIYYSIALLFLSYINRWGLFEEFSSRLDLSDLVKIDVHSSWEDAVTYFQKIMTAIFENKVQEQEKSTNNIIVQLQKYILGHLHEDLSLVKLAETVYLNPSYLSRLFKQCMGKTLTDYLNEVRLTKAKELIRKGEMKIYEIAEAVGFESAPYFTRVFKKEANMTPQEFKDSAGFQS